MIASYIRGYTQQGGAQGRGVRRLSTIQTATAPAIRNKPAQRWGDSRQYREREQGGHTQRGGAEEAGLATIQRAEAELYATRGLRGERTGDNTESDDRGNGGGLATIQTAEKEAILPQ